MRRWIKRAALVAVGYAIGRTYAQAWLDRASPADLRHAADRNERHEYLHYRAPRRTHAGMP